jgi:3-isopropylmalate/(R)-2-methylmalate dehydratase small subunit
MQPFTRLEAPAAPIDLPNVDTDRVIPARFLRKPQGSAGYERYLFHDVRFDAAGGERPEFVLNQPGFREAKILVAAENFGCGSSREAAVWALAAYGIRAVLAPSLGDIFHQNCGKNGVLAVILPAATVADLRRQLHARPGARVSVDLEAQTVTGPDGAVHRFEVDPFRKQMLLAGQDDIGLTLGYEAQIAAYESGGPDLAPKPSMAPHARAEPGRSSNSP